MEEVDETHRPSWQHFGKCTGSMFAEPDLFFPVRGGSSYTDSLVAKAVCNGEDGLAVCPVREECLQYALDQHEEFGVWGGMSTRERRRYRRALKARARAS